MRGVFSEGAAMERAMRRKDPNRVALVIGNSAYRFGAPLGNSINDAEKIAAALRRLQFTPVQLYTDLDLISQGRALADFVVAASGADMAVIYFAGHGIEINGKNFLLPVGAELDHVARVPFET